MIGTIKMWNAGKGYGFIEPPDRVNDGKDVFLHVSEVRNVDGADALGKGDQVSFETAKHPKGLRAVNAHKL